MSAASRIEPNIILRERGTYAVSVRVCGVERSRSFASLEEARAWRDEQIASRPKREHRSGRPDISGHRTEERTTIRRLLAEAPRTTVVRDGREYTIVHLPEAA
jgi:hypothetical protein